MYPLYDFKTPGEIWGLGEYWYPGTPCNCFRLSSLVLTVFLLIGLHGKLGIELSVLLRKSAPQNNRIWQCFFRKWREIGRLMFNYDKSNEIITLPCQHVGVPLVAGTIPFSQQWDWVHFHISWRVVVVKSVTYQFDQNSWIFFQKQLYKLIRNRLAKFLLGFFVLGFLERGVERYHHFRSAFRRGWREG